ncbi:hypothetical protein KKD62_00740 [Patescibacteria group bacterium]|nr:hypothetical protein [Patescibacteria group bacterium]MBU1931461.1 hypothetical protein [Patescibacteria group bacterium]
MGEEDFYQATPTPESGRSETKPNNVVLPITIAVVGLGLIAFAAWPFFRSRK